MRKNCSECGPEFSCDNSFSCWCSNFPKLTKEQIDDNDCICRECLLIRYRKKFLTYELAIVYFYRNNLAINNGI